ncbi:MAG: lysoplasmalogenase [Sphingomonadaceae bacterium]|nr:lysoplasmalogenase [Sphingomonadaceae bacterium]
MTKRALIEHRPLLLASIVAAIAFYVLKDGQLADVWKTLIKGAGVGLLAAYALLRFRGVEARWIALVMALGAAGDMAIENWFEVGGALFFLGHVVAIAFYLRYPRKQATPSQKALAVALLIGTPLLCWLLSGSWQIALYGLALGGMASTAWMSRFPRYRVGVGAVLFVISDWLIFSRLGPIDLAPLPDLLIWPLYYFGQFLICTGVIQQLRREHRA